MFEWFVALSPLSKLAVTLLLVVALMRIRVPMGAALLSGAGLLALLFPMAMGDFGSALLQGLISLETLFLLFIIVGILVYSGILNATGQITRIIESFRSMAGASRLSLVMFPALIGLLPMPGGAIFSAPMVGASAEGSTISPAHKTLANYWFRHIWEFWFPLYPGVALFLALTQVPVGVFILMQLPMTIWALAAGYLVILRGIQMQGDRRRDYSASKMRAFLLELTPIFIVVGAVAFISPLTQPASEWLGMPEAYLKQVPILLGLGAGMLWLAAYRGLTGSILCRILLKKNILEMIALALGLMMFKSVLGQSGAVVALRDQFAASGVPLEVAICLLTFAAGMVVGIAVGFVGTSFPVVLALLAAIPEAQRLPYLALAFSMGYLGMMLSPVHICLLLTNEYFKSRLGKVYPRLIALCAPTGLVAIALFLLYRRIF